MYETVIEDFGSVGRYRVRLVESRGAQKIDVREYIESDDFVGFTKRGIRLAPTEVSHLIELLRKIVNPQGRSSL